MKVAPASARVSPAGVTFIAGHEGRRHRPYEDGLGHCTVGVGHLLHLGACTREERSRVYSDEEIDALLAADLAWVERCLARHVTVDLTQDQYDALASFVFNWGCGGEGGFPATSICRLVNDSEHALVPAELMNGRGPMTAAYPEGRPYDKGLRGVRVRRKAEGLLYAGGMPHADITRADLGWPQMAAEVMLADRQFIFVHHGASPTNDLDAWRQYRQFHMGTRGWRDIGYNFGVLGDGRIAEGRGRDVRGAHTAGFNTTGIGVCVVGDGDKITPAAEEGLARVCRSLIDEARSVGTELEVRGHRDNASTSCPSDTVYRIITRPGWPEDPTTPEEDWMAALSEAEQRRLYELVEDVQAFDAELKAHLFGPAGDGDWVLGAHRLAQVAKRLGSDKGEDKPEEG